MGEGPNLIFRPFLLLTKKLILSSVHLFVNTILAVIQTKVWGLLFVVIQDLSACVGLQAHSEHITGHVG